MIYKVQLSPEINLKQLWGQLDSSEWRKYKEFSLDDTKNFRKEVEIIFFKKEGKIDDEEVQKEYELLGLESVDPYALIALNLKNPSFCYDYPNGTHWKNNDQQSWSRLAFNVWGTGQKGVFCTNNKNPWDHPGIRWFGGILKNV